MLSSIQEAILESKIAVYPNPSSGQVWINVHDLMIEKIDIFDVSGKKIASQQGNNEKIIPLSILNAGTYFLRIQTDRGIVIKKVVQLR